MCHFVPHDDTVNAQFYAEYLQNHLRRAGSSKRPQLKNVIILHAIATPYKAICVGDLLRHWRWSIHHTHRIFRLVIMI